MNKASLRTTVVGAGAIGGLLAARLARSGQAVSVVARGSALQALRAGGLTVIEGDDRYTVAVDATDSAVELGEQDVLYLCLKGQALVQAAPLLKPLVGKHTRIVSVMNGIPWWFLHDFAGAHANRPLPSVDPGGVVSDAFPPAQASGCVVHLSSAVTSPGVIRKNHGNRLVVGAAGHGARAGCAEVANTLESAGFEVSRSDEVRSDIWMKLWGNMTMNPISALTRSTTDMILADPLTLKLAATVMKEAKAIGEAFGITLDMTPEERNRITAAFGAMKTSMLRDVEDGRSLEVDALLGGPLELAQIAGVPAPYLEILFGLSRQLDANLSARPKGAATAQMTGSEPRT